MSEPVLTATDAGTRLVDDLRALARGDCLMSAGTLLWAAGAIEGLRSTLAAASETIRELREAARAVASLPAREREMRKQYPPGTCNAEDAWRDFAREENAARDRLASLLPDPTPTKEG